jgi:mRNA interferase MazF
MPMRWWPTIWRRRGNPERYTTTCALASIVTLLAAPSSFDVTMDRDDQASHQALSRIVNQGDVFWIDPDPSRGSIPGVAHPHVVVQDDVFNHSRIGTVVVCALSSNPARAGEPGNVALDAGEGGLTKRSVVVVSQVSSLYKARLGEHIGVLSAQRVAQILAGMRFLQASFFDRG